MLTALLCQCKDWAQRTDEEIHYRMKLIEEAGNVLHGFAPLFRPRKRSRPQLVFDRTRQGELFLLLVNVAIAIHGLVEYQREALVVA